MYTSITVETCRDLCVLVWGTTSITCFFIFYFVTVFSLAGVGLVWVGRASQSKAITGSVWTSAHTCWVSHSLLSLCVKSNTYLSKMIRCTDKNYNHCQCLLVLVRKLYLHFLCSHRCGSWPGSGGGPNSRGHGLWHPIQTRHLWWDYQVKQHILR